MTTTPTALAPRPGPRTARRRRFGAWLTALLLVLAPLPSAAAAASPAAAKTRAGAPASATEPSPPPAVLSFSAAPHADGILGTALVLSLVADNATEFTVPAQPVAFELSHTPLASRAALDAWAADGTTTSVFEPIAATGVPALPPHETYDSSLAVDLESAGIADLAPGVYPLRTIYGTGPAAITATSVVIVPDEAATAKVGVVVPITAGPMSTDLLSSDELALLTGQGGALREQLDAVAGTPAILAVDPAIAAAIRVLGPAAPATSIEWLDDLLALPNPRFALQFGDADLATQLEAGLRSPLEVSTLAYALDAAAISQQASPSPSPTPTPSPTETPAAPTGPDLATLLSIGAEAGTVFWPATGTAGADIVDRLGAIVREDAASITLVPSSVTTSAGSVPARATAGEAQVLVYDSGVSAALQAASLSESGVERDAHLAEATAYAAFAAQDAPGATMLVTVDRGDGRSRIALHDAISAATALPGHSSAGLDELLAQAPHAVTLVDVAVDDERVAALDDFRAGEGDLASFATVLADPTLITGPERATILQLLGNAWLDEHAAWQSAVSGHREQTQRTLTSVAIVPPIDFTFATSSAPLPFSIRNDLPWPVSVVLIAAPNDPRLIVQTTTPVEAGAAQVTKAGVPVEARVGSGESTIDLQLRSPTMVAIGDQITVGVAVRAEWESVGIAVMVALVALLIVFGIVRTVRHRRAARGQDAADADAPDPETTDGAE